MFAFALNAALQILLDISAPTATIPSTKASVPVRHAVGRSEFRALAAIKKPSSKKYANTATQAL